MGGRLQKRMASASFRTLSRAGASLSCCGLSVNRCVFRIIWKNREAAGCFRAVTASHCPLQKGLLDRTPAGAKHSRGFPKTVHPQVTLTVPETGTGATVLRCFAMVWDALRQPCGLSATTYVVRVRENAW